MQEAHGIPTRRSQALCDPVISHPPESHSALVLVRDAPQCGASVWRSIGVRHASLPPCVPLHLRLLWPPWPCPAAPAMSSVSQKHDALVTQMAGRVRVDAGAHFATNESTLSDQDKPLLDDFAKVMRDSHSDALITVEGVLPTRPVRPPTTAGWVNAARKRCGIIWCRRAAYRPGRSVPSATARTAIARCARVRRARRVGITAACRW